MASNLKSWLSIHPDSPFSLANIPFGIISTPSNSTPRTAVAIGEYVFDLCEFAQCGGFKTHPDLSEHDAVFQNSTLNAFAALGRPFHRKTREYVQSIFIQDANPLILQENPTLQAKTLLPLHSARMHLPMWIGDYTDFYAGRNHAFNAGSIFRDPSTALQPNYLHLPVAYHGRASSVVVSGTYVRRPWGQRLVDPKATEKKPEFAPTKALDFELELGMFVCTGNTLGEPIDVNSAENYIFGFVLMNDWSARDIQSWEYVPLGPFGAKNFCTTISPWVVLADALEPFRVPGLQNDTELLPYLRENKVMNAYNIPLSVGLGTKDQDNFAAGSTWLTLTNARNVIWSFPQMIAHHTLTGCNLRTGDLFGSGTISGPSEGSLGSVLEITKGGKQAFKGPGGADRLYLEDGDIVAMKGAAGEKGALVGFGDCIGVIGPAIQR